jgi:hypothetical protein
MRKIALLVEDYAHQQVIGALVERFAQQYGICVRLDWRNARQGYGRVVQELKEYLRDLERQGGPLPDVIIVATDANCKGLNERTQDLSEVQAPARMIFAIPDPHIERWLLLDGHAFKAVFGRGCDAPDLRCSRDRYKQRLIEEIRAADIMPSLGGIEFADDIVIAMDFHRACTADRSLKRFLDALGPEFRTWAASKMNQNSQGQ